MQGDSIFIGGVKQKQPKAPKKKSLTKPLKMEDTEVSPQPKPKKEAKPKPQKEQKQPMVKKEHSQLEALEREQMGVLRDMSNAQRKYKNLNEEIKLAQNDKDKKVFEQHRKSHLDDVSALNSKNYELINQIMALYGQSFNES